MEVKGRCYCGELQYKVVGDPVLKLQCHCRDCQYLSGGAPAMLMAFPMAGFEYTSGKQKCFSRSDIAAPPIREFCATCGTHIMNRHPSLRDAVILKVGTFDDPKQFPGADIAIYMCDAQPFHIVPDGVGTFERTPGS